MRRHLGGLLPVNEAGRRVYDNNPLLPDKFRSPFQGALGFWEA